MTYQYNDGGRARRLDLQGDMSEQPQNTVKCPECGAWAEYQVEDNGVCEQQVGPAGCESCGWVQPSPEEEFGFDIDDDPFA